MQKIEFDSLFSTLETSSDEATCSEAFCQLNEIQAATEAHMMCSEAPEQVRRSSLDIKWSISIHYSALI